ncbi:MAG: glycosyltransferase [Gemmataceae bacterium]|nr:glycosyltransferase [Gemmataceae bacterium]
MVDARDRDRPSVLVFADDWGRHPSSCQHLASRLLASHSVYWVNTIGTRAPHLDWATVRRGLEKLRHWARRPAPAPSPARPQAAGPRVLNPKMWPRFSTTWERRLNRELLARQLCPLLRSLPAPPVAVTTIPLVADLIGRLPVRRWVYYCVDDFGEWPGLDRPVLQRMEEVVVRRADLLIAVSQTLQDRLAGMGRSAHLLTHGVDLDFWSDGGPEHLPELAGLERPLVVFWGVVDQRMDLALVRRLGERMPRGTILLIGPEAEPSPELLGLPRVARLGPLAFEQLPGVARAAAVLVMPYADLPVTRAMQPLKLKEYLATGRPTVFRDLPSTRPWGDCADLADSPEAFARAVCLRLETGLPEEQRQARGRLAAESWDEKARRFESWALSQEASLHATA